MHIVVINYFAANPPDFPATFYTFDGRFCTSTLVGPRVLLTAAHCVPDGTVLLRLPGPKIRGTCRSASNPPIDLALCALTGEPAGVIYETVNSESSLLRNQEPILLSGFGCTVQNGAEPYDPAFRLGFSWISRAPAPGESSIETNQGAALCDGDSGAPSFLVDPSSIPTPRPANAFARRLVVAVGDTSDSTATSTLISTSSPATQEFFRQWTHDSGLKICGFSPDVQGCRTPPAEPTRSTE